jgi:hypothetical protein
MEAFPFTAEEWSCVSEAARAVLNATFAEDDVLHASRFEELRCVLSELRGKYGQHPALLETEADFTEDPSTRVELYEQAKQFALAGGWVTYSIRISLARVLLEELGNPGQALQELMTCRDEVAACAAESEREEWHELQRECARQRSRRGSPK